MSKTMIHLEFSEESTAGLRGRQSVRTTFRLSQRSIHALSILARQLGIKQKSLFDHLIDDSRALKTIAREFDDFDTSVQRVAKTYVVSRKTLEILEMVSVQYDTPRDALVEFSIERILPLIAREKVKHAKRKRVLREMQNYVDTGLVLLQKAENDLGSEDPVFIELYNMMKRIKNSCRNIDDCIVRGNSMESF
jgi:hypothetical protein